MGKGGRPGGSVNGNHLFPNTNQHHGLSTEAGGRRLTHTQSIRSRNRRVDSVAAGFERILMLAAGAEDIRDVMTFSFDDTGD